MFLLQRKTALTAKYHTEPLFCVRRAATDLQQTTLSVLRLIQLQNVDEMHLILIIIVKYSASQAQSPTTITYSQHKNHMSKTPNEATQKI